jgi:hypothetical protein
MIDIDWKQFGFPKYDTGYSSDILQHIWENYCGIGTPLTKPLHLYRVYKYIHRDLTRRQSYDILCSKWYLHYYVINTHLSYLSTHLNEIHWSDRLSPWNHGEYFPFYVTAMTDTTPIYVQQPQNSTLRSALFNRKYSWTIYKLQISVDFLGRIVCFSGPHIGNAYDAHIWNNTSNLHPVLDWEYLLGDGHYGSLSEYITPHTQPQHGHLSNSQYLENTMIAHYRSRIEHVNAAFKCHKMMQVDFRGGIQLLNDVMHVTAHTTNVVLHKYLRYTPVGPWEHNPI